MYLFYFVHVALGDIGLKGYQKFTYEHFLLSLNHKVRNERSGGKVGADRAQSASFSSNM